jgi:hypothetical protein
VGLELKAGSVSDSELEVPRSSTERRGGEDEPLRGFIEIVVVDRHGKTVAKGRHEMRSFLNNYLRAMRGLMGAPASTGLLSYGAISSVTVTNTAGSSVDIWLEWYVSTDNRGGGTPVGVNAADNDDSYGIIVGSGTTVPSSLDQFYNLESKIAHGTGSGQLDYGPHTFYDLGLDTGVTPPVYRYRLVRTFTNLSGAGININEVGIVARNYWKSMGAVAKDVKYLIARDVLSSTYTVPNGGTATVAITVEVEVG